ncbi:putative F-box/LRR-repeat protein [Glycine soja]
MDKNKNKKVKLRSFTNEAYSGSLHSKRRGKIMQDAGSRDYKQKRSKANNEEDYEGDLINQLPDGIPVAILSKLPINDIKKAAGRQLQMAIEIMYDAERQTYTTWIDELLSSLKNSTLQGLKFWFHVGTVCDVDKWIHFAIQKKVQKLELYFGHTFEYVLPLNLFKLESFNSLHVLRLKSITVTKEMLEYLLCCCSLLETLSLVNSGVPKTMMVSGSLLKLKYLELVRCWELIKLEIFAENLASFKYYGSHLDTEFKSVPSLVGKLSPSNKNAYLDLTQNEPEVLYWLSQLPKLKNLKHLELAACVDDGTTLACALLLKASPSLWRFTVKVLTQIYNECGYNLKELELVGFCGAACEVELVMYILENVVELQKIIIDTRSLTKPELRLLGDCRRKSHLGLNLVVFNVVLEAQAS